jgi:hypothetical protein
MAVMIATASTLSSVLGETISDEFRRQSRTITFAFSRLACYGIIPLVACAPDLEALDRTTRVQPEEIIRLQRDVSALEFEDAETRVHLNASNHARWQPSRTQ